VRRGIPLALALWALGCARGRRIDYRYDAARFDVGAVEHAVHASDYERACASSSDCVPVYEGSIGCCGGGEPNTAITKTSGAAYQKDFAARAPECEPTPCEAPAVGTAYAICTQSVCELLRRDDTDAGPDAR
jgi:hypothetical protein